MIINKIKIINSILSVIIKNRSINKKFFTALIIFLFILNTQNVYSKSIFSIIKFRDKKEKKQEKKKRKKNPLIEIKERNLILINFKNIIDFALNRNLDIAMAESQIDYAKANKFRSYALFMPSIQANINAERFEGGEVIIGENPVDTSRTTIRPMTSINYRIFTGGKPIFELRASKSYLKQKQEALNSTSRKTLLDVIINYFSWLRDFSKIEAARQEVEKGKELVNYYKARYDNGFGTLFELMQAQTKVSESENKLLETMNQVEVSEVNLASMLNIPLSYKLIPEDLTINAIPFFAEEHTLTELYDIAKEERPEFKELTYFEEELKNRNRSTKSDLFPSINVGSYVRQIGPSISEMKGSAQASISLNIDTLRYMGISTLGTLKMNKVKIKDIKIRKERFANEINKNITKNYYDYALYKKQLLTINERLETAEEAYRLAQLRFKTGFGLNLEITKAQTDLTQIKLDYYSAVLNYNVAQLRLLYESGQLLPEKLLQTVEENNML